MHESELFGRWILVVGVAFLAAIFGRRLTEWLKVPAPGLFLVGAAVASDLYTPLTEILPWQAVERICVVALIVILFDGGMDVGMSRFRGSWAPMLLLGIPGTLVVAGGAAVLLHLAFGLPPVASVLL